MTIDAQSFWGALKTRGYTFFTGVPDSTFGPAYTAMMDDPEIRYVPAVREDVALGVASGAYFAGAKAGVVMQNSGVGNVINTLTSFSLMYKIPVLLIVGWRGYGGPPNDAPEHWIMGAKTADMFSMLEMPYEVLDEDGFDQSLERLDDQMAEQSIPGALLVRAGVLS
mgnify:FL=1